MLLETNEGRDKYTKQSILEELNEQQKIPVINYNGASIVIAGAGSGKTKMIVSRAAYMIVDGIKPHNILMFTFTKKGANEIKERVRNYLGEDSDGITIGTYHSFCMKLLRKYCESLGWKKNFTIYDTDDSTNIIKEILKDDRYKSSEDIDKKTEVKMLISAISKFKDEMISPSRAYELATKDEAKRIAIIYNEYQKKLKEANAFDFDDLIYYTIRMFEAFPDIKKEINDRYHYITADESQDSSPRDLELIYHLGGERMNICLVGDDYQSIYSFRGSNIEKFFSFVKQLNLKKYVLERNYRSTKVIVNAANNVVSNNDKQFSKKAFSSNDDGEKVILFTEKTETQEASRVAACVKTFLKNGYSEKDIAVLYRMSFLAKNVEKVFLQENIKYKMAAGTAFYAKKEIKDIMGFLRVLVNPQDVSSLKRIINIPKRGIGEKSIEKIITCIFNNISSIITIKSLVDIIKKADLKGKAKKGIEDFCNILLFLDENQYIPIPDLISLILQKTNYVSTLDDIGRMESFDSLVEIAKVSEDLTEFVLSMSLSEEGQEENENAVTLMTVHGSKGLEWKIVIVIGVNEGTMPHNKSILAGDVSEERRLFYVAMTRAKEYLLLTRSQMVMQAGGMRATTQSRFVSEIGKQYLHKL